ncbi:MAG: Arginine-tRNA ligase, partial [Candidatus Collierbacteria bacterium GW2011_GWC2_43_12]
MKMKIKEIIKKTIKDIVGTENFSVEHPADEKMGDYASNIAMVMAKQVGKNPRELASEVVSKLSVDERLMEIIEKMEVAGPGFINFWVKDVVL